MTPDQLKTWREANSLTIEQAAQRVGVAASTWWRWETGKQMPKGCAKAALARAMSS